MAQSASRGTERGGVCSGMNMTSGTAPWNNDAICRQTSQADPRLMFLRKQETEVLCSVVRDLASPGELGVSGAFLLIGLDPRFKKTEPEELFDLIAGILRERMK